MSRPRRRLLFAAAVLAAGFAVPDVGAAAATGGPSPAVAVAPDDPPGSTIGSFTTEERIHANHAGMTTVGGRYWSPRAPKYAAIPAGSISPDRTGDLDGDGKGDVIVIRYVGSTTTVTVRRGINGTVLWTWNAPNFVGLVPVRIGNPARPGIVIASSSGERLTPGSAKFTLHVAGFAGGSGQRLWQYAATGIAAGHRNSVHAESDVPFVEAVLPGYAGRAARLVVGIATGQQEENEIPVILSAADGTTASGGDSVSARQEPYLDPRGAAAPWGSMGDVDDDGWSDYYAKSENGLLTVRSSTSGQNLWTRDEDMSLLAVLPHTTADRKVDVQQVSGVYDDDGQILYYRTVEIDGSNGKTRWTHNSATTMNTIHDVDRDGIQDSYWLAPAGFTARSGRTGAILWVRQVAGSESCRTSYTPVTRSDVQPDGAHEIHLHSDPGCGQTWLINGRDGVLLKGAVLPCCTGYNEELGVPVDGKGDDFIKISDETGNGATVSVLDGLSRKLVWSFHGSWPTESHCCIPTAADLTGDGRAEVVLTAPMREAGGDTIVIDGATGQPRWAVHD